MLRFMFAGLLGAMALSGPFPACADPSHAIAMHGSPRLPPDFPHFPYVAPDVPKGGRVTLGAMGSFDSLNPFIVRGEPVQGMREFVIESLMARSQDEPFTLYAHLAESIDVPPDRSEVTFRLNPKARFSDGSPVTADDVIFSFEVLRDRGRPNYRTYYRKVVKAERVSDREVRFVFDERGDREMPLILGLMPVLARHSVTAEAFEQSSLTPLLGSGPYRVGRVDPGRSITYVRDETYWGRDLNVTRGRFNFDEIRFEYFREESAMFEAFKTGAIDLRIEDNPALWAQGYDFPAANSARVIKLEMPIGLPAGMTALVFNTRRPVFADTRVREALALLFNFEWINNNLYHGLYKRTHSFFERSILSSAGKPADAYEQKLLAPYKDLVRADVMAGTFKLPNSDPNGHNRTNVRRAYELLEAAGFTLQGRRLVNSATGERLTFEILATNVSQERLLSSYAAEAERLGIRVRVRFVDSAQYQSRLKDYDYDMIQFTWPASLSPGNEQLFRWSSRVASEPGSYNYAGVQNPAVDAMISALLSADSEEDFVSSVRALDRALLSGSYVIPLFHPPVQWIAYWTRLGHPETPPLFGFNIDTWWVARPK